MQLKQACTGLWAVLFIIAPLYSQANLGGIGLDLTFNISIWLVASWLTVTMFFKMNSQFVIPKYFILFCIFPLYLIVMNIIGNSDNILFNFRLLFIFGGLLFFIALFQCDFSDKDIDKLLFIIVIAVCVQACVSVAQIILPDSSVSSWFYSRSDGVPRGIFQQVNVNVSLLTTGVIISLYLCSRNWFDTANRLMKGVVLLAYSLSLYIIFASGSRVGLLALIIAVPLMIFAQLGQFRQKKTISTSLIIMLLLSFGFGQAGLEKTMDKTAQLNGESYANARIAMYTIGAELVVKEPMGYGMGSFLRVWNPQASEFIVRYPETQLPPTIGHPHNEFLLWMIEGGVPAVLALLLVVIAICIGLWHCGFKQGSAYAALLIPISLHTQVELPFYISALHWLLWLFLVYLVMRHQQRRHTLNLSTAANKSMQISALVVVMLSTAFLVNTAKAEQDLFHFVRGIKTDTPPLSIALNNVYTKNYAEQLVRRSNLYAYIEQKNRNEVDGFIVWAKDYVSKSPELKMYEDLISASVYLNPEGQGCDMIREALTMYAHNKPLQEAMVKCQ